jgi:hypothetical protein
MRFQSRWDNAVYTVRPTYVVNIAPGQQEIKYGLKAVFGGRDRIFDSNQAQVANSWTDADREQVEQYLLKHRDFGAGLYLAPGESAPVGVEVVAPEVMRCSHIATVNGKIAQCKSDAVLGTDLCAKHRGVEIVSGMVSTKDTK